MFQSTSPSPCPPGSPPVGPLSLTTRPEDQQPPPSTPSSVKQEDARVSSGSEDDETRPTGPLPPGFSLVPSSMFGHGIMYMSPYLPPRGPAGCSTSMLDERRKRNRTFIDPVTEVPRLEAWFTHNTHPSHAVSWTTLFNYRHVDLSFLCINIHLVAWIISWYLSHYLQPILFFKYYNEFVQKWLWINIQKLTRLVYTL